MENTKQKIKNAVEGYKKMFPLEYDQFCKSTRKKQDNTLNDFAELEGSEQIVRHLFDIPETLYFILKQNLTEDEWDWFFGLNNYEKNRKGVQWFIRTFPQFKITKDF